MKILLIDIGRILASNLSNIIASGSMLIAAIALWVTSRAFYEHNRPYLTFNIEGLLQPGMIFFYIRNTGIRGAQNVKIKLDPTPKSYALQKIPEHSDRSLFEFSFIAPNQTIRTFFDHGVHRYENGSKPENDKFSISVSYQYLKRNFSDNYDVDISYLSYICDSSTPSDIEKGFIELHKDLNMLIKTVNKLGNKEDV